MRLARTLAVGLAAAMVVAGLVWWLEPGIAPDPAPPSEVAAPLEARALPTPDAGSATLLGAGTAGPVSFQSGFCSEQGQESFEVRFTLERLLAEEVARRQRREAGAPAPTEPPTGVLFEALRHRDAPARLVAASELAAHFPDSALAQVVEARAAQLAGDGARRLVALRRARTLAPGDPAIAWGVADALRDGPELDEPIEALGTYLQADPVPGVARLRARLEVQRDIQRGYQRLDRDGLTVLWPGPALAGTAAAALATTVDRGLDEAAALTGTARRGRLTVVVYPSRSELMAVSCVRAWAGALFDGTLRVVATDGAVDERQVRHETLHAQLSPVAPKAPKWFHEGLAQSFAREPPPTRKWALMVKNRTWVPFASLDGSFQVFDSASDADLAYAQSYAMVELVREVGGEVGVRDALSAFGAGADTATALAKGCARAEVSGADLLDFLGRRLGR